MKNKNFCTLAACAVLAACSTTVSMFPVRGPVADSGAIAPLHARATGILGNSGDLTMTLPSGVACTGRWSSAAGAGVDVGTSSLWTQYGQITGTSAMIHGSGQNPGAAVLTCADGTVFDVEFVTGAGTAEGFGVAKDNRDNIYRVIL